MSEESTSEEPTPEKISVWTRFRLKTNDWTIMHWAALGSVVTLGLGIIDRIVGRRK